ncbi:MAG: hypothetical protein JWO38_6408 [Gemmataceae bacterium]|nr:hypothetical protein [Gemmataceae bacterium]
MGARALFRSGICVLAALAAGCVETRADRDRLLFRLPGSSARLVKSGGQPTDNTPPGAADPARGTGSAPGPGGEVSPTYTGQVPAGAMPAGLSGAGQPGTGAVPAGGLPPGQTPPGPILPGPPPVLPLPNPVPGAQPVPPGSWPGVPGSPPGVSPGPGASTGGPPAPFGPHVRGAPTAAGALLNLGPGEIPADRVVELAKQVEAAAIENRALVGRIKDLEAVAVGREQALAETLREVESASAEVTRARADLQSLRKELAGLKDRLEQVEKEDVETLRAVIAALEKLLLPAPRPVVGRAEP